MLVLGATLLSLGHQPLVLALGATRPNVPDCPVHPQALMPKALAPEDLQRSQHS